MNDNQIQLKHFREIALKHFREIALKSRILTLQDVKQKIKTMTLAEEYAGHYHQGFGMAIKESLDIIDGLIKTTEETYPV